MATKTAAELIRQYFVVDAMITEAQNYFDKHVKPYREECEAIKAQLLALLNEQNIDSVKSDFGTAYKSVIDTPKIENYEGYLDFCLEHWDTIGNEMLQIAAPKKDALRHYMATNSGHLPPFVSMSSFTKLNIRRS